MECDDGKEREGTGFVLFVEGRTRDGPVGCGRVDE